MADRNAESHFAGVPAPELQRSAFWRNSDFKTTFNTGELIPIYLDEVLPGDTFTLDTAMAVRMSTPIYPVMDNAWIDTYFFYVPNRLLWEHWKEFCGESSSAWAQQVEYTIPTLTAPAGGWSKGTLADHFGLPTGVPGIKVNALPFRGYAAIYNTWFRDQNLIDEVLVHTDDTNRTGSNGSSALTDTELGGKPLRAAKYHDYFTSCLPGPQKGVSVAIPITQGGIGLDDLTWPVSFDTSSGQRYLELNAKAADDNSLVGFYSVDGSRRAFPYGAVKELYVRPVGLAGTSVSQLRTAFALQRLAERDATGGTRYREILRAHFGVVSPDARMQIPEYLGGSRTPVNINQVIQTSATDSVSPQGNTAAYSLTTGMDSSFTKSFTEHGYLIGLAVIRTNHSYQQGIDKLWLRRDKYSFYWPALANISEQPVYTGELYAQEPGEIDPNYNVFGYQEAWADYRYKPSHVAGAFRSNVSGSLDAWHYADYYTEEPYLSAGWIDETAANVDRTLAVSSSVEDQWLADFYFRCKSVRCMPIYSVPGLLDHH